ncbi:MAG: hypothetical protein HFE93_08535 [Acutalibacter muris]|uniref:hypothetical protein n=1 Tax=Acutalibacter muris TaxID=1796620 RepID=UPI00272E5F52|nr:hypothetical protein [Acutalibacter muris]MCI9544223.1 hypothetical protein [Acutalibacter muris]
MKKRRGAGRGKPGTGPKLLLAIVTCVNLILTLLLAVMRRQDTLRAIQGEDGLKLLLERTGKKE